MDLNELRLKINEQDEIILMALARRMRLVRDVERLKRAGDTKIYNEAVEVAKLDTLASRGEGQGLDRDFVRSVFYPIMGEASKIQMRQREEAQRTT